MNESVALLKDIHKILDKAEPAVEKMEEDFDKFDEKKRAELQKQEEKVDKAVDDATNMLYSI